MQHQQSSLSEMCRLLHHGRTKTKTDHRPPAAAQPQPPVTPGILSVPVRGQAQSITRSGVAGNKPQQTRPDQFGHDASRVTTTMARARGQWSVPPELCHPLLLRFLRAAAPAALAPKDAHALEMDEDAAPGPQTQPQCHVEAGGNLVAQRHEPLAGSQLRPLDRDREHRCVECEVRAEKEDSGVMNSSPCV